MVTIDTLGKAVKNKLKTLGAKDSRLKYLPTGNIW